MSAETENLLQKKRRWLRSRLGDNRRRLNLPDSDSSGIGDIAFLLLIFFIVTSSFVIQQGIFLGLPSPNAASQRVEQENLAEIYPQLNDYLYNQQSYSREELLEKLITDFEENEKLIAVIYMTDDLVYNRLVETLSIVREAGLEKVSVKNSTY